MIRYLNSASDVYLERLLAFEFVSGWAQCGRVAARRPAGPGRAARTLGRPFAGRCFAPAAGTWLRCEWASFSPPTLARP